jgi:lipoprotein-anchoring transpeptidase ErfK/SrfK
VAAGFIPSIGRAADDSALRSALAWQIALDRAGFSPAILDGKIGPKAEIATRELQKANGLPATGKLDPQTAAALGVAPDQVFAIATLEAADLAHVGPNPKAWIEKSKLPKLLYPSLEEFVAERFHCTKGLLARLNPGKDLSALKPGDRLCVPAIAASPPAVRGERIDIHLTQKVVRVFGKDDKLVGLFHCSIAADKENLPPVPSTTVAVISENPSYTFDPEKWPEVKDVKEKLTIPPGPRNPVGLCWMGLALHGYGIHGSPTPEMIGKTGSHGCFRLTNWDALRLAKMIRIGTPVTFSTNR